MDGKGASMVMEEVLRTEQINRRAFTFYANDNSEYKSLKQSIISNGIIRPIVVADVENVKNIVLDGVKIFDIGIELGQTSFEVKHLGRMDNEEFIKKHIQLNVQRFPIDYIKLSELVSSIKDRYSANQLSNILPYDVEAIKNLFKLVTFDWDSFEEIDSTDKNQQSLF